MKIRLEVSPERQDALVKELAAHGITVDNEAELVLREAAPFTALMVKDSQSGSRILLPPEDILLVESFGHTVEVHTDHAVYYAAEPLYQLASQLDSQQFIRISNSVIIAKSKVRSIAPTLSMKFILTMHNGQRVDVTRSYYYIFKDAFGI